MLAWGGRTQSHDDSKDCATESSVSPCVMDLSGIRKSCQKRLSPSSCPTVCLSAWNNLVPITRIFMKFDICEFFENVRRKSKFNYSPIKLAVTFILISRIILKMRNFSYKSCRENQNTHFTFSNFFPKIVFNIKIS
jgi:hypothetical protein